VLTWIDIFAPTNLAMQRLNLPTYSFNLKSAEGSDLIFDTFRNRWVTLTPEEWVRQNVAMFLVSELGYPASLILLEQEIRVNRLIRRCDVIAYNRQGKPVLVVECKAPEVPITQKVFDQVATYNLTLGVKYLLITNGLNHYCVEMGQEAGAYSFLKEIPSYSVIEAQSS
jgi:hypothetical protein